MGNSGNVRHANELKFGLERRLMGKHLQNALLEKVKNKNSQMGNSGNVCHANELKFGLETQINRNTLTKCPIGKG